MKKRLLFISLAVALVLTTLIPASVLARGWGSLPQPPRAQRFNAIMTPTAIDPTVIGTTWPVRDTPETNVWPIVDIVEGDTTIVGWIVDGRTVYGGVSGDFNGTANFTYGGILDTLQSGSMEGVLAIQTGPLDIIYLAASGTIEANVTEYYTFEGSEGIAVWCQGAGLPVSTFFSLIYNAPELQYLPFEAIQAMAAEMGIATNESLAGIYEMPDLALLDDETLAMMYGDSLPLLPMPDDVLKAMYEAGQLPPLPKTLTAEFKGTLRIDAGTGAYSGVSGQGTFGPDQRQPLTLHVYPNQHVYDIDGAIKLSGTYTIKPPRHPFEVDQDKLLGWMKNWKDSFGQNGHWQNH